MQGIGYLLIVAVGLGADAFSVAVCVGLAGATARQKIRLALGFGVFQFIMPIVGLAIGSQFGSIAGSYAHYIGGLLLIVLGLAMSWRAISDGLQCPPYVHSSFFALIMASLAVSIDALAVGVGYALGVKEIRIIPASMVIGFVAFMMTIAGVEVGNKVGIYVQQRAPFIGGIILVIIGILIMTRS